MGVGMLPDDAPTKGPVVAGRKCCALFQGFEVWRCGGYGFYCQVLVFLFSFFLSIFDSTYCNFRGSLIIC